MKTILLPIVAILFCTFALAQPKIFQENIISTGDYETHPCFSPSGDSLYFLKCLPDASFCAIYFSVKKGNAWSKPYVVPFSGKYSDADPFVTKDGKTLFFVSNRPIHPGDSTKQDWDIWKVAITKKGWGQPTHLGDVINSRDRSEFFPTLADSGNLYFGSERVGGKGRSDLYVSKPDGDAFGAPENLGDSINTANNEYEAHVAPDESYIIFMATVPNTIRFADFYITRKVNGVWTKARKLSAPINSPATEWGGRVTRDGRYFYFGSGRNSTLTEIAGNGKPTEFDRVLRSAGNGLGDIYFIEMSAVK